MNSKIIGIALAAFAVPLFLLAVTYESDIKDFLGTNSFGQLADPGLYEPGQLLYFTSPG